MIRSFMEKVHFMHLENKKVKLKVNKQYKVVTWFSKNYTWYFNTFHKTSLRSTMITNMCAPTYFKSSKRDQSMDLDSQS
jgi:hypothetical protein